MIDSQHSELPAGSTGELGDDSPMITHAHIRPYVVASLLHRGAVRLHEVVAAITPHCRMDDLKVGAWDPTDGCYCEGTRLEKLTEEVLEEFSTKNFTYYNESKDLWVLTSNNLSTIITWVTALNSQIPKNLLESYYSNVLSNRGKSCDL